MRGYGCCLALATGLFVGLDPDPLQAQAEQPAEKFFFASFGMDGGEDSFVDLHPGNDLLPYTDDDLELPERGNVGGIWSSAHHDNNSNGIIDDESEHIFVTIKRQDDGFQSFSVLSRPEYGVLYEAEDWTDHHDARNQGPSSTQIGSLDAEGNDFEHNDRPAWEGESNAFLYNNFFANQHGKGKPRYYFENINPSAASSVAPEEPWVYQEIQGWEKSLNFQHNLDDPTTGFDERGDCRREYMRTNAAVTRGYLIPVEEIPDLEDGSLPTLFGWEDVDLAAYLRDTIAPLLEEEGLHLWSANLNETDYTLGLPPTHLMLLQIEAPMEINAGGACGAGQAAAQAMADYWGIPESGGTYRVSQLLGFSAELHAQTWAEAVHPWLHSPEDGIRRNLWLYDPLIGSLPGDPAQLGGYEPTGATWALADDPGFAWIEETSNLVLRTSAPGSIRAPLPRALGPDELPLEVVVDIAVAGPGDPAQAVCQLILEGEDGTVIAYADIGLEDTSLHVGGALDAQGVADAATSSVSGPGAEIGDLSLGQYTRYVLSVTGDTLVLREKVIDTYSASAQDFTGLEEYDDLISLTDVTLGADPEAVRFTAYGWEEEVSVGVSAIALFASPPSEPTGGRQKPGDFNQDGKLDLSDPVALLGSLFLGGESPPCGERQLGDPGNLTLLDGNGDGKVDLSDAVYTLQFLFLGGPPPVECVNPSCGDCILIPDCPDVCM